MRQQHGAGDAPCHPPVSNIGDLASNVDYARVLRHTVHDRRSLAAINILFALPFIGETYGAGTFVAWVIVLTTAVGAALLAAWRSGEAAR